MASKDPGTQSEKPFGIHTIMGKKLLATGEGGTEIWGTTRYMTRMWIGRLRLHIFWRGDEDPDPHDHPWDFWTFPLARRGYVEEVTTPTYRPIVADRWERSETRRQVVRGWQWSKRAAEHVHRVTAPVQGDFPMATIIWRGPIRRQWGFWRVDGMRRQWIHWKTYLGVK